MEKTAKEMFGELGFKCAKYAFVQVYENESGMKIKFDILDRNYTFGVPAEPTKEKYWSLIVGNSIHKAIHQQMKDFGWIKDEKSTPKELAYEGDDCDENGVIYDTAICPSCDKHFEIDYDEHAKYCPDCGQALKWMDENE